MELGQSFGRYRTLDAIGAGGMGVVYRARDEVLEREVALKILPAGLLADPAARERFRREALALSKLNHPNIAAVYDYGTHDNVDYLVMEYVVGETLARRLERGPLSESEILSVGSQIAVALGEAHENGVIHRDLKPGNIAITTKGIVKVLDFGLAKLLRAEKDVVDVTTMTDGHTVRGTLPYMAPEQLMGNEVEAVSDIYAVGAVLYEMSTGRRPFPMTHAPRLIDAILHEVPAPPTSLNRNLSPALESIVMKAMEKDPRLRFGSAGELASSLTRLSSPETVIEFPGRKRSAQRRHGLLWGGMAAALLFAALGIHLAGWTERILRPFRGGSGAGMGENLPERPILAVLPLTNVSGDPSIQHVGTGIAHSLTTSLSAIPSLTTISPSAAAEYEGKNLPAGKIARDLGADYIVAGSVQRSGARLRLTVNLVRPDDSLAWGGDTEGDVEDLFALERRLASELSGALRLMLTETVRRRLETPPTLDPQAFADYLQARAFLERPDVTGNIDRAITLFQGAIQKDPNFALAHAGLGEAYWSRYERTKDAQWTGEARRAVEEARRIDPDQAAVRYSLAVIYRGTGRVDDAIAELNRALALRPNSDDAYRLLGDIFAARGKSEDAVAAYRKAIEIRPNFWGNHRSLGVTFLRAGRYPEAITAFHRVTELQPDLSWGFQSLGLAHHAAGNLPEAVKNYEQAIRLGPSPASYSNLGTVYYRQARFEEAARMYQKALELRPGSPATLRNLGDAYRRLGRTQEAESSYVQAIELTRDILKVNPKDGRTLGMLALYEAKLGRKIEAARHGAQALREAPDDGEVLYRNAVVHALAGERKKALALLERALNRGYSAREVEEDDDLLELRSLPEFQRLVKPKE